MFFKQLENYFDILNYKNFENQTTNTKDMGKYLKITKTLLKGSSTSMDVSLRREILLWYLKKFENRTIITKVMVKNTKIAWNLLKSSPTFMVVLKLLIMLISDGNVVKMFQPSICHKSRENYVSPTLSLTVRRTFQIIESLRF